MLLRRSATRSGWPRRRSCSKSPPSPLFIPAQAYSDLDDKESRALEKIRKEQEAAKKKESVKSESSWKMFNAKKATPYGYNYGKPSYSGSFSGGSGGLGSWALQQLLSQQLNQGASGSGKQKNCGGGQ